MKISRVQLKKLIAEAFGRDSTKDNIDALNDVLKDLPEPWTVYRQDNKLHIEEGPGKVRFIISVEAPPE